MKTMRLLAANTRWRKSMSQAPNPRKKAASASTPTSENTRTGGITSSRPRRAELWRHVGELAASSATLLYLASEGSDRLSLSQGAFFLLAATAEAAGKPATRTELLAAHMGEAKSIRNSYRQLLEPSRVYPVALGWLHAEENPMDAREQLLKLTEGGKRVIEAVLLALEPISDNPNKVATKH